MFGSYYFGQIYFGDVLVVQTTTAPDNCGGMWGSATFGSPYFGQHIQCPEPVPPIPPAPTPSRRPSVAGSQQRAEWFYTDDEIRQREANRLRCLCEKQDEEDIALIVGLWLNRRQ